MHPPFQDVSETPLAPRLASRWQLPQRLQRAVGCSRVTLCYKYKDSYCLSLTLPLFKLPCLSLHSS